MLFGTTEAQRSTSDRVTLATAGCQLQKSGQIEIKCLRPELMSAEDIENSSDSQLLERLAVTENIDFTSPLSSLGGESTAYYFDQMQVETCATPMGLGMEYEDVVALWNPSKFPKGWDGKKKKRNREKLKERIIRLTSIHDCRAKGISRRLNPVLAASHWPLSGSVGLAIPDELVTHSTCSYKPEVDALLSAFQKRFKESKCNVSETEIEWARTKLFDGVELDLGFSSTALCSAGTAAYYWDIWVKSTCSENEKLFTKVVFTMHVTVNGTPRPLPHTVAKSPFRYQVPDAKTCPFQINFEIFYRKPNGQEGIMTVQHEFGPIDRDADGNLKWNQSLDMGEVGRKLDSGIVKTRNETSFCLPGLAITMEAGEKGKLKNICQVIDSLLTWSNRCQRLGCHQFQLSKFYNEESPCKIVEDIFKCCAGFSSLCITDLLCKNVSSFQYPTGEWKELALYIGPVRNSETMDRDSLLPIVRVAPHLAKGTVDDLVRIWKCYAAMEHFRLPEGPFSVTYNGQKIDVGSNTNVADVLDQSLFKHYFAFPLPGTDTRDINDLLEFIEGTESGEQKKKKKRSKKKEVLKETPAKVADKSLDNAAVKVETNRPKSGGSESPASELYSLPPIQIFDINRELTIKPEGRAAESKVSGTTEQSSMDGDVDSLEGIGQDEPDFVRDRDTTKTGEQDVTYTSVASGTNKGEYNSKPRCRVEGKNCHSDVRYKPMEYIFHTHSCVAQLQARINKDNVERIGMDPSSSDGYKMTEVYVSGITKEGKFYACNDSDRPVLEELIEGLKTTQENSTPLAGSYKPKKGEICAAKHVDGQWYRARINMISANKAFVQYIDSGNRAFVQKTKLGPLPTSFLAMPGYAKLYSLALVNLSQDETFAYQAVEFLRENILGKTVKLKEQYKIGSEVFVSIHIENEDVGKKMVEDGLLLVKRQGGSDLEALVKRYEEAMDKAKKDRLNIWRYRDNTPDGSGDELGATASGTHGHDDDDDDDDDGMSAKGKNCERTDKSAEKIQPECDNLEAETKVPRNEEGSKEENVGTCQDELASFSHGQEDSGLDPNIQALKEDLASKEAKLGDLLESCQVLVETKGKDMSVLLSAVEDVEEEKHSIQKEVAGLELEMNNMRDQLVGLQEKRDQVMAGVEEKDKQLKESLKKKKQLEDLIEAEVDEHKRSKRQLEKELESLKVRIGELSKDEANTSDSADKANQEAQRFLLNINKKIEAKESDLECPVCLEVSTSPIYSCDEQHIICSDCKPKVNICSQSLRSSTHTSHVLGQNLPRVQGALPGQTAKTSLCREGSSGAGSSHFGKSRAIGILLRLNNHTVIIPKAAI